MSQAEQDEAFWETVEVYTSHGFGECGDFALALAELHGPTARIGIIIDEDGRPWSDEVPFDIAHVYVSLPEQDCYDAKGRRSPREMAADFNLRRYRFGPLLTPTEFVAQFCPPFHAPTPEYTLPAQAFIEQHRSLYGLTPPTQSRTRRPPR